MDESVIKIVVFVAAAGAYIVGYKFLCPQHRCPKCNTLLKRWRKPKNSKQIFWGGRTCDHCGAEIKVNLFGKPTGYVDPKAQEKETTDPEE